MPGPRDYTPSTKRRLFVLSGAKCSSPNCNNPLVAPDSETIISKICHIEAAEPGGARFNSQMTDDERRHFNNLILLCDGCHSMVDNPDNELKYPKELLLNWKKDHESLIISSLSRKTSLLSDAIKAISAVDDIDLESSTENDLTPFSIEGKIKQNSIIRNKVLIEEYKVYYSKINSLYDELEAQGTFKKSTLLNFIRSTYLKVSGKYIGNSTNHMEIIQSNSDNILEEVREILSKKVYEESGKMWGEEIEFGLDVIVVDAFIRCKILEKPL